MPSDEIYEMILNLKKDNVEVVAEEIFLKIFKSNVRDFQFIEKKEACQNIQENTSQKENIFSPHDLWIFGYGSLMWKADFPYIDKKNGFIRGYQRRFYQNSIDHRGTPTKPGRVVTLMPAEGNGNTSNDEVFGVAYRISEADKNKVLRHLDYREKNGYERCTLEFTEHPVGTSKPFLVTMYIATTNNESYAGHISQLEDIAEQISTSFGPSGSNQEYLFNLANTMRELFPGVEDNHLFELETMVRIRVQEETIKMTAMLKEKIKNILMNSQDAELALQEINWLKQKCDVKNFGSTCI